MQAPCEVRVNLDAEGNPFVLPREVVDATRGRDQVPSQSDQRRPVRRRGACHAPAENPKSGRPRLR
eukprot:9189265-Alexandrium_andersonii.AAC.1